METQVLIIGGGVTGVGLARDLALRGVNCVVVEKGDLNSGASGSNHGLLHSGARYVSNDARSAQDCRDESHLIKRVAADCVEDTGGLFVAVAGDDEGYIADFQGLCQASGIGVQTIDCREAREMEPELAETLIAAYRVDDASINPFKLSIDTMAHAEELGARMLRYTEVTGFQRCGDRIVSVHLLDRPNGRELTLEVDQVVNASGAWAKMVAGFAGVPMPLVCSQGSVLVTQQRMTERVINRLRPPADGDIIVPSGTVSLIGTTSVRLDSPDRSRVSFPEVDLLVTEASRIVPAMYSVRYIRAFEGVRSLPFVEEGRDEDDRLLSRSFEIRDHEKDGLKNFVSVFGGKLTLFRLMAERVADLVCERMGVRKKCLTREVLLPSSEMGEWVDPHLAVRSWLGHHDPHDTLLCECEMVPASVVDRLVDHLKTNGVCPNFNAIGLRSRVGKGSCQGAFCAFRICAHLYRTGIVHSDEGLQRLKVFLEQRWHGLRPVLWGQQLVQEQLQEAIHCGLFGLDERIEDWK